MSAVTQGSEEGRVEAETRDGSDSPNGLKSENSEKSVERPPVLTGSRTEEDLLGDSNDDSDSSTHTIVMDTNSDDDRPFDPDLPTGYVETDQATSAKELVIKDKTPKVADRKSEKKVPKTSVKESMEGIEASEPSATPEIKIMDKTVTNDKPASSHQDEDEALDDLLHIRMLSKEDFMKYGHVKSGRYCLPEVATLNEGRKSGSLKNLVNMASLYPCGATYQCCYTELPMLRISSASIDDFSPLG